MKAVTINRQSAVSVGVVIVLVTVVVWAIRLEGRVEASQKEVDKVTRYVEESSHHLWSIDKRLSRIEGKLDGKISSSRD